MKRDDEVSWSRLGRIEKLFLVLMAIWALLYFTGMGQKYQMATALSARGARQLVCGGGLVEK